MFYDSKSFLFKTVGIGSQGRVLHSCGLFQKLALCECKRHCSKVLRSNQLLPRRCDRHLTKASQGRESLRGMVGAFVLRVHHGVGGVEVGVALTVVTGLGGSWPHCVCGQGAERGERLSLIFLLLFSPGLQPVGWFYPHQGKSFLHSGSSLETPSQTHPTMCLLHVSS